MPRPLDMIDLLRMSVEVQLACGMVAMERPMFTLKDDDPQITWDHKAMAARPFRARKD